LANDRANGVGHPNDSRAAFGCHSAGPIDRIFARVENPLFLRMILTLDTPFIEARHDPKHCDHGARLLFADSGDLAQVLAGFGYGLTKRTMRLEIRRDRATRRSPGE
jgi:hypothetical protein